MCANCYLASDRPCIATEFIALAFLSKPASVA